MKIAKSTIVCALLLSLTTLQQLWGQVQVQLRVLPPYQSRISEYASRPDLLLLTLSSLTDRTQEVQLSASLIGDNGVSIRVRPDYRSPEPILLMPGEVKPINAYYVAELFDLSAIECTGVDKQTLVTGPGLPEGMYQMCINVLDYTTLQPISQDNPGDCSDLTITNIEPPTLLTPSHEQQLEFTESFQPFPIIWNTPPGAPMSTRYQVKIVEMLTDRNPNDAFFSATTPSFFDLETSDNLLLYGPSYPALAPGRKYALAVQAFDPLGIARFRNNGLSEVITFTYGKKEALPSGSSPLTQRPSTPPAPELTTHTIKGKVVWSFQETEAGYRKVPQANSSRTFVQPTAQLETNIKLPLTPKETPPDQQLTKATTSLAHYFSHSPLQQTQSLAQADITLRGITATDNTREVIATASGSHALSTSYELSKAALAREQFALAGATVILKGIRALKTNTPPVQVTEPSNPQPVFDVIASGTSTSDGFFTLHALDPSYGQTYSQLTLAISAEGFAPFEKVITPETTEGVIEVGELILRANTFRLEPRVLPEAYGPDRPASSDLTIRLYREASDVQRLPHLMKEGNEANVDRTPVTIDGREWIPIATEVFSGQASGYESVEFGFGSIFVGGLLYLQIESSSGHYSEVGSVIRVTHTTPALEKIPVVQPAYSLRLSSPSVTGRVTLAGATNLVPVEGAVVRVYFEEKDLLGGSNQFVPVIPRPLPPVGSQSTLSPTEAYLAGAIKTRTGTTSPLLISQSVAAGKDAPLITQDVVSQNTPPLSHGILPHQAQYTAVTDADGKFFINGLPLLTENANYTLRLISLPHPYREMPVTPETKEWVFLSEKGKPAEYSFSVAPEKVNVVGKIVDEHNRGVSTRLHFEGSANYFESGPDGLFHTTYFRGKHTLVVEKEGYVTMQVPVNTEIQRVTPSGQASAWVTRLKEAPTVAKEINQGKTFSPELFGWSGSFETKIQASSPHLEEFPPTETLLDLGEVGPLKVRNGKVRFLIVDATTNHPIEGATLQVFDSSFVTPASGEWLYEGRGGIATVTVLPPPHSSLSATQRLVTVAETGEISQAIIRLETGIRVFGYVRSEGKGVGEAVISIEGNDYLKALSNASGAYSLVVPKGEWVVRAAKSGYIADKHPLHLENESQHALDFVLSSGNGRNIATLLGFDIELDKVEVEGNAERWTGRFVNMTPFSEYFVGQPSFSLPFSNVRVTFDREGNPLPANQEVITDIASLTMKLHGFLPIRLQGNKTGSDRLKVTANGTQQGELAGVLVLDFAHLTPRGITLPDGLIASPSGSTSQLTRSVFRAGSPTGGSPQALQITGDRDRLRQAQLYGFSFDITRSSINREGIQLGGTLLTPEFGPLSSAQFEVTSVAVGKDGAVKNVEIARQALPIIRIGGWAAKIENVIIREGGFRLGGKLEVPLSGSGKSAIEFSNLVLASDALYGGQFRFPEEGFDVYGLASLSTAGNPLAFGRVGNSQIYSLAGAAHIRFPLLIRQPIRLPMFQLQTDGGFQLQAPVNYTVPLPFADFRISQFSLSTPSPGKTAAITLQGNFSLEVSMVKLNAASIRFMAQPGGGVSYDIGTISGELKTPLFSVGLTVGVKEDGFEGGGKLGVPGTPISAEMGFHYFKKPDGIDLRVDFAMGAILPLGIAEINELGGGVQFNTSNGKFALNITGGASLIGLGTVVNLKPISLTVTDGPVISGSAAVTVGTVFQLTQAKVTLDFREEMFVVEVNSSVEPLKKVASAKVNGLMRIKWARKEPYVFLGVNTQVHAIGILNSVGEYAIGINIRDPNYRNDDVGHFFRYLDDDLYARGSHYVFTGVYLHAIAELGRPRSNPVRIGWDWVGLEAWLYSRSDAVLLLNLQENDYRFQLAGVFEVGAEACAALCIGIGFKTCYRYAGSYSDGTGWYLSGMAGGAFSGKIATKEFRIAAHAGLSVSSQNGINATVGLGSSNQGNLCSP